MKMTTKDEYEPIPIEASGRVTMIVNPNDDHNRTLYVTIEFPDGEVYRGYVEKSSTRNTLATHNKNS